MKKLVSLLGHVLASVRRFAGIFSKNWTIIAHTVALSCGRSSTSSELPITVSSSSHRLSIALGQLHRGRERGNSLFFSSTKF